MLLALDTTGPYCSAALHDGKTCFSLSENLVRGHAERLMPLIEELFASQSVEWGDITEVATTTGPGSFTGLRVGMSVARGLALSLRCPCYGVSVFEAFAQPHDTPLAVAMDAKRDQIWLQVFDETDSDPMAVPLDNVLPHIPSNITVITGSAALHVSSLDKRFDVLDDAPSPSIENVALVALAMDKPVSAPKPLYLRSPDAKPQTGALIT